MVKAVKVHRDPLEIFENVCLEVLKRALERKFPEASSLPIVLEVPPDPRFGDLAYPCFTLAKKVGIPPLEVAKVLASEALRNIRSPVFDVIALGLGYVNFKADYVELAKFLFKKVAEVPQEYGIIHASQKLRIVVEHTSGNPIHPLTVGTGRNAFLGDTIARLLEARGHKVERHFYIDDVGFQVALAAFVYSRVKDRVKVEGKPDRFIGLLYAISNALMEIQRLKKLSMEEGEEAARARGGLNEWVNIMQELRERNEELFNTIVDLLKDVDLRKEALVLNSDYERGEPYAVKVVRELCNLTIKGFKETLNRSKVDFDSWDWESELTVWSGAVEGVVEKLRMTPFTSIEAGALILKVEEAASKLGIKEELGVKEEHAIPSLTLTRADGTTLYTTRDLAYAIWKLRRADRTINIIGSEQSLAQLQLKIALHLLGYRDLAEKYIHYAYELVQLPGFKMSSRKGRYIALDMIIDETVRKIFIEVDRRWPTLPRDLKLKVAEELGVGAVRYALISVSASKPIVFDWDRVVNFERNSLPFINYAYVRASNILKKGCFKPREVDPSKLSHPQEREMIMKLCSFPRVVKEAADELRPEVLANYLNELSLLFNSYYEEVDVIHERDEEVREARLMLVYSVKTVVGNGMKLMGIAPVEFM